MCALMRTDSAAQRGACSKSKQSMAVPAIPHLGAVREVGVVWSSRGQGVAEGYKTTIGNDHRGQGWLRG